MGGSAAKGGKIGRAMGGTRRRGEGKAAQGGKAKREEGGRAQRGEGRAQRGKAAARGEAIATVSQMCSTSPPVRRFEPGQGNSANFLCADFGRRTPTARRTGCATRDRFSSRARERFFGAGNTRRPLAAGSGGTGPRDRRRTKTIHFGGDSGRPSVRQSRREARGSAGGELPNRKAAWPPKPWRRGRPPASLRVRPPDSEPQSPQPLLAARDLATPALAGGHWRNCL